jgi:type IV pilus modification protein PilV
MSKHNRKRVREQGFSLLEVVIATLVIVVGLVGVAATITSAVRTTDNSKYSNMASMLASEKLEDLSRWPSSDPHVTVPTGASVGSLTSDAAAQTIGGVSVNYYDNVSASADAGAFTEIVQTMVGGAPTYTTTSFTPQGFAPVPTQTTTAPNASVTFDRRWLIEINPTINGVAITGARRVTVWVQSVSLIKPPITFQMSVVRP